MKYKLKKGEAYIDTVVTVFINLVILYLILNLFSYMITYQKLNHAADNIIRCAAIHGTTDDTISEDVNEYITNEGFERSKVEVSFDSTEYMSGSSKNIQFGDTIILNVKTKQSFKFIGKTGTSLFNISINKTSLSEKYHQSNTTSNDSGSVNEVLIRNGIVPEGGTYTYGYEICDCTNKDNLSDAEPCNICGYNFSRVVTILTSGDNFPESPLNGDTYTEGDYEYKYNFAFAVGSWYPDLSQNGWAVRVLDTSKSTYSEIISEIAGQSVTNLSYTFNSCTSLVTAPTIPSTILKMEATFNYNTALTGNIIINANPTSYEYCFNSTVNQITITGSCSDETKAALAATANNGNITY